LRVLVEQDRKIGKFDSFFISISLASACSYDHQLSVETPSSKATCIHAALARYSIPQKFLGHSFEKMKS